MKFNSLFKPAPAFGALTALCLASTAGAQVFPDLLTLQGPASGPGPLSETSLSNGANYGWGVAISGDTMAVGVLNPDTVYVYRRDQNIWAFEQQITPPPGGSESFGSVVDIDGDTMVVGMDTSGDFNGSIYIYERTGTTWTLAAQRKVTADSDNFGESVAVSGDLVVAGHVQDNGNRGAVHTFRRDEGGPGNWGELPKLVAADGATFDEFGYDVGVSGDTLVVGSPFDDDKGSASGSIYVYTLSGDTWVLQQKLTGSTSVANDWYGYRVGIDGDVIAAGSGGAFYARDGVYIYERDGASWTQSGTADNVAGIEDLHVSGNSVVAGFPDYYPDGAIAIVAKVGATWLPETTIAPPDEFRRRFGQGVGVDDDTIVVGDPWEFRPGTQIGTGVAEVYATDFSNVAGVTGLIRKFLYQPDADDTPGFSKDEAAFRFKTLLYTNDATITFPDYSHMVNLWGPDELQRSRGAEELLLSAMSKFESPNYGRLLLDIYYDRTAAQTIVSKESLALAERDRLGPPVGRIPPPSGFVVDNEIERYEEANVGLKAAISLYFELFGLEMTPATTEATEPDFGYNQFRSLVPGIHLEPATILVGGVPQPVTVDDSVLFTGYRDLVMLYGLLQEYGSTARQIAHFHWSNGDIAMAEMVAADAQRYLLVNGSLLDGIFPELDPDSESDSGLDTAVNGYRSALGNLDTIQKLVQSSSTPLGFDKEFLMLVQKFQGQSDELYDSFNSIKDWLEPTQLSSQLRFARDRQAAAIASYNTFRGNFDEVQEQFEQSTISFEFRLFEIAGARPGEPGYDTPQLNEGSEIWQQMQSIDLARLRIQRNRVEIDNLREEIFIEQSRAADVQGVVVDYGNRQAKLTEEISHLRAAQAAADAYASAFSIEKLNPVNIFFNAVNAGVQTGGELAIGQKEAQKERLAAAEKAQIEGIDSAARVKTLWLGMRTLVLDSQEAVILMKQEAGRLAQLLREQGELERRLKERDASIARRYYADPIHRLTSQYDMLVANLAFDSAQKWIFFMARALEYKWNAPFIWSHGGVDWTADSVFQCRNAEELYGMYLAMIDYDGQIEGTRFKDDFYDWFSVREDFFGYRKFDDGGQPATYFDAETGETVDAVEMFRRRLKRDFLDTQGQVRLEFSTLRQLPGGTFFRGARFLPDGSVDPDQRGLYLDKIRWMKIRIPGNHNQTRNRKFITGSLTYGGTSYIRNESPGTTDPTRADRIQDEYTPYSTRYWFLQGAQQNTLPNVGNLPPVWRFREALTQPGVQMWLTDEQRQNGSDQQVDVLPSVQQIDVFKERSVATTGWRLIIPTSDLGTTILDIDELDDVEIYYYHYAVVRP